MGASKSFPRTALSPDRVVIVTGANTGIGYETAKWIAMLGAHVILACRSQERALQAITRMKADFEVEKHKNPEGLTTSELSLEFMELDCASLKSSQKLADEFIASGRQLHVLLCNAGLGMHKQAYTEDGNEMMFQVNYLSHFLLITKLLPVMLRSGTDCRIIMVSSLVHANATYSTDDIQGRQYNENNFSRSQYYYKSKLYQVMQMFSLNRRIGHTNVTVNTLHPGVVQSEFTRTFTDDCFWTLAFKCAKCFGMSKTPFDGAKTSINAAVNPKLINVRDVYFSDCKPKVPSQKSRNEDHQEQLWQYSITCLKDYLTDEDLNVYVT